jgi:septum formation protein
MPTLILASTSPYRRALLERFGLPFGTARPDVDETPLPAEPPADVACRLAQAKASAVARQYPGVWVIGSDQVAEADGNALGKSGSRAGAVAQLRAMSGREIRFHTALCLQRDAISHLAADVTRVRFRPLALAEIERYVDAEQPFDCAGSFKVEGLGIALFDAVHSDDPTALIGLPLIATARLLRLAGFAVP